MDRRQHWDRIYSRKGSDELSWYQADPATSLRLITSTGIGKDGTIVDAGGGDSLLVDKLLDEGYTNVTVIDVSTRALERARERLGERARLVNWVAADVLELRPAVKFDVWHDRAVFHFLTDAEDRAAYVRAVLEAVKPGGQVIIATFGLEAPPKCSGLHVAATAPSRWRTPSATDSSWWNPFRSYISPPAGWSSNSITLGSRSPRSGGPDLQGRRNAEPKTG